MPWFATLGGLTAWAVQLVATYLAIAMICGEERRLHAPVELVFVAICVVALGAALAAAAQAYRMWRRGPSRTIALMGLLLDLLGAAAIVWGGVIPAVLRPCA